MAEELALQEILRQGGPVDGDEGAAGAPGAFVDHAGQDFLADAALPGQEDGGVDARDAAGEVEGAAHPGAARDDTRVLLLDLQPRQLAPAHLQLRLGRPEGVADAGELAFEATFRKACEGTPCRLVPVLLRLARHPADRVPLPDARLLDDADRAAVHGGEVAAREAGQRPADRLVREAEVEEVLLGLVRLLPDRLREVPGRRSRLARDRAERDETLQAVQPPARLDPLLGLSQSNAPFIASAVRKPCAQPKR